MNAIWPNDKRLESAVDKTTFQSARCGGKYTITGTASAIIDHLELNQKMLLTESIRRAQRGAQPVLLDSIFLNNFNDIRPPGIAERFSRGWHAICFAYPKLGELAALNFSDDPRWDELFGATFSSEFDEIVFYLKEYENRGFIEHLVETISDISFRITLDGHLQHSQEATNEDKAQAFVAMWFDEGMQSAWQHGIEPCVRSCGYLPLRIDQKEHNNKIDDEIISEIKRSKFLIADFTSEKEKPRGGVYYEAGFAQGLGLPVIWACRKDLIDFVHFDTRQFNHIVWERPDDLAKQLRDRILATIGPGPNFDGTN